MRIPAVASRTFERFKDDLYFGGIFRRVFQSLQKLSSPEDRVQFVHREIDRYIKHKFDDPAVKNNVACKESCAMCCHTQVSVTDDEAEILASKVLMLISQGQNIDISKLRRQADTQENDKLWYQQSYDERKCTFLSDSNKCMVYEVRPAVCRSHHVVGVVEQCSTQNGQVRSQQVLITHESNMVIMAAFIFGEKNGALAKRVWDVLASRTFKGHETKKIKQKVLDKSLGD